MNDSELLELAAKAAGYQIMGEWFDTHRGGGYMVGVQVWNPFIDDGDALRLAIDLSLDVYIHTITVDVGFGGWNHVTEGVNVRETGVAGVRNARALTTRRAIVRAAAEIGQRMTLQTSNKPLDRDGVKP